ncbi:MAG: cell division protein ZapE, partial [Candidatus Sedimenticola endophacoides]
MDRGKTWPVDIFFNQLPIEDKLRPHFHQLMARAHERLATLRGRPDPLDRVAGELATGARVICLDEFIVSDIGDAMILAGLLCALFRRGVTLVTTSNTRPDDLYRDGIQRAGFLPAIALLKRHTRVLELGGDTDYRLRYLEQAPVYHTPLDAQECRYLVKDFGTSQSPKSTRQRDSRYCPD